MNPFVYAGLPCRVVFGVGSLMQLPSEVERLGAGRVLILSTPEKLALMVVEIGLVHPPVGMNVYIINRLAKDVPLRETFKGVIPFLISDFVRIVLLLLFPAISLVLVRMFHN